MQNKHNFHISDKEGHSIWHLREHGRLPKSACHVLLRQLTFGWTRRDCTVLDLGSHDGEVLENLWFSGFDVTGQESDEYLFETASSRMEDRAQVIRNNIEALPYEDASFDYVTCMNLSRFNNYPAVMKEALRLASKSVVFGFTNKLSCYGASSVLSKYAETTLAPLAIILKAMRSSKKPRVTVRSNLIGPQMSWRGNRVCSWLNLSSIPLPIGAYVAIRVDFKPPLGSMLLPLLLNKAKRKRASYAAGEIGFNQHLR